MHARKRLRLETFLEAKEDSKRAEITFRTLYRLTHGGPGRPKYSEFDWNYLIARAMLIG